MVARFRLRAYPMIFFSWKWMINSTGPSFHRRACRKK